MFRNGEKHLFLSFKKPHHRVSKDTIGRWLKLIMSAAGVDTNRFKPHSTRAAAVSKAGKGDVPITEIMTKAGWTNERTFQKYYNKPLIKQNQKYDQVVLHL